MGEGSPSHKSSVGALLVGGGSGGVGGGSGGSGGGGASE